MDLIWECLMTDFVDPSKGTLVPRVQLVTGEDEEVAKRRRGEYSQWRERFMYYLEEQTDGEATINSIQNGDQPLPVIAQVSLARTAQNDLLLSKIQNFGLLKRKRLERLIVLQDLF
nr:hypothetical protein [Tanacetum cinerariifolium]